VIPINDLTRGIANSEEAADALTQVLKSGYWIHGPEHKAFEIELSKYLAADFVLGVASGTDALEIALRAVGCKRESKVITVANAGGYTPVAAASIGCEIIYCDVDPVKLVMDPESLGPLISEEITAVVVTHLYGNVAPIGTIKDMCDKFGIKVIEDCAQAIGATESGVKVGTIGHVGTFSFYPTKNLGAIGDGGAVATNDPDIAQRVIELRQYGWTTKYKIDYPGGLNSRLDEIQAAILRIGLRKLDYMNARRREIIECYREALQSSKIQMITSGSSGDVAHLAVLALPNDSDRASFRTRMQNLGIQTDIHYPILDCHQKGLGLANENINLPLSEVYTSRVVTIPLFPDLNKTEVVQISEALRTFDVKTTS
jgi:dTDP-4-amino-4,6-dideoxygalactose transaminase